MNLHEDQMMTEKLRYFLRSGDNRVGRVDAENEQNIVIGGLGILKEHCLITRQEVATEPRTTILGDSGGESISGPSEKMVIAIRALGAAKVFVNASLLKEGQAVELHHADRLVLGNSNVFRVSPDESARDKWLLTHELSTAAGGNSIRASGRAKQRRHGEGIRVRLATSYQRASQQSAEGESRAGGDGRAREARNGQQSQADGGDVRWQYWTVDPREEQVL